MSSYRYLLILASVALGQACATHKPPAYVALNSSSSLTTRHTDPPKSAPSLTNTNTTFNISTLYAFALKHAPVIQAAKAEVNIAGAKTTGLGSPFPSYPTVEVKVVGTRTTTYTPTNPASNEAWGSEVTLKQEVEIGGQNALRQSLADANLETQKAILNEVKWKLHAQIHKYVVRLMMAKKEQALSMQLHRFSQEIGTIIEKQIAAGEVSPHILLIAKADIATSAEHLLQIEQNTQDIKLELAKLIGWSSSDPLPHIEETLPPIKTVDTEFLHPDAFLHYPETQITKANVDARAAADTLAQRESWISPSFGAFYAYEAEPRVTSFHQFGILIEVPLPFWNANEQAKNVATYERHQAEVAQHNKLRQVALTAKQLALQINGSAKRIQLLDQQMLPNLYQHLEKLRRAYEIGEIPIYQVMQTKAQLFQSIRHDLDARLDYYDAVANYEALTGSEFWSSTTPHSLKSSKTSGGASFPSALNTTRTPKP